MADDSLEEFRLTDKKIEQIEQLKQAFEEHNITHDGELTVLQLESVLKGLELDELDDPKVIFSRMDADGSGSVDVQEFFNYFFDLDAARELALAHKGGLHSSVVFCRVRPISTDGGHADGQAVEMKLDGWTESSIQVTNRHEKLDFTFPKVVIAPERSQEETFDCTMPQFCDAWLAKCYNVQLLAYGQTGTGKTHTMFGTSESLSSNEPHSDWGIFPRIVHHCLKANEAAYKVFTGRWALMASAVEFYMGGSFDLLREHAPVTMDAEGSPLGLATRRIRAVSDLVPFLDTVNATRTMSKTKMNAGSSRSHCALILTLYGTDHKTNEFLATTFTVVDMAGSERTGKTGAQFVAPTEIASKLACGKMTLAEKQGMEGGMINFELTLLATEVEHATQAHSKRKRYVKPRGFSTTDTMKFLGRSLDGHCLLCMVVCISQSPQHGWETWFSCTYGERLAKLKAPLKKMKLLDMNNELKLAEDRMRKSKAVVDETRRGGAGKMKFLPLREATARGTEEYLEILQELVAPL